MKMMMKNSASDALILRHIYLSLAETIVDVVGVDDFDVNKITAPAINFALILKDGAELQITASICRDTIATVITTDSGAAIVHDNGSVDVKWSDGTAEHYEPDEAIPNIPSDN